MVRAYGVKAVQSQASSGLVLIAVGGVAVCAMLIYREPSERRIAEVGKFLAVAGIIAAFTTVLGILQDRFRPPK